MKSTQTPAQVELRRIMARDQLSYQDVANLICGGKAERVKAWLEPNSSTNRIEFICRTLEQASGRKDRQEDMMDAAKETKLQELLEKGKMHETRHAEAVTLANYVEETRINRALEAMEMIGKYVIVQCKDAGVHAGILESWKERRCTLSQSRSLRYWKPAKGAAFLSGAAKYGLHDSSQLGTKVPVILTDSCEIIECTPEAQKSISEMKDFDPSPVTRASDE